MAKQTAHPLSLFCSLCSRFSAGSNESRQQLCAQSVAAPWSRRRRDDGVKGEKEERDGEREGKKGDVCSSDHRQSLDSAPGRFSIYLFRLSPSVSFFLAALRKKS